MLRSDSLTAEQGFFLPTLSVIGNSIFSKEEMEKIRQAGPEAVEIAGFFEKKISEANALLQEAKRRYRKIIQAESNGDLRFHDLGNVEGDSGNFQAQTELVRAIKYFNGVLLKGRGVFLLNPRQYPYCIGCGKKIPRERLEEVPHTRWCVSCKNKHNGNGHHNG